MESETRDLIWVVTTVIFGFAFGILAASATYSLLYNFNGCGGFVIGSFLLTFGITCLLSALKYSGLDRN